MLYTSGYFDDEGNPVEVTDGTLGAMTNNSDTGPEPSAFSADEALDISVITQMRIYDVLLGIYTELAAANNNTGAATALMELHDAGKLLGPLPKLNLVEGD